MGSMLEARPRPGQGGGHPPVGPGKRGSLTSFRPYLECESLIRARRRIRVERSFRARFRRCDCSPRFRSTTRRRTSSRSSPRSCVMPATSWSSTTARPIARPSCSGSSRRSRSSATRRNQGYGAGLKSAFPRTLEAGYDGLVTLDCDGQHEPSMIPDDRRAAGRGRHRLGEPLPEGLRPRAAAARGAAEDQRRGDALAQRVPRPEPHRRLLRLQGVSHGRAGPVRDHRPRLRHAACRSGSRRSQHGMSIVEVPVPLIYLDESRAFGGALDDGGYRLNHYREVFEAALRACGSGSGGGVSLMKPHRLRAPSTDGALLAEPPLAQAAARLAANAARLARWDHDFQGRQRRAVARHGPPSGLRASAALSRRLRPDVPDRGRTRPLPWSSRAISPSSSIPASGSRTSPPRRSPASRGAWPSTSSSITTSSSRPRSASPKRVPRRLSIRRVEFDEWARRGPLRGAEGPRRGAVRDRSPTGSTTSSAARCPIRCIDDVLAPRPGPAGAGPIVSACDSRWHGGRWRRAWGVRNLEVPLSTVCETEAFLWFAAHLLAHLPRFQQIHNDALARYRSLYGIRSRHHPVPALGRDGDWREAPFWVWRAERRGGARCWSGSSRSRCSSGSRGEAEPLMELPLGPDREACCAVEQLAEPDGTRASASGPAR